jgi:glycosyltransferase involved in cell wall biosynthesis
MPSTRRAHVLLLAESCNPEWPSLPVVGYKYAKALAQVADVTLVTHIRNRENIEKAGDFGAPVAYIDNEWIAARMYRLAKIIRGGDEVAWSANQMMALLPYIVFERQALKQFRDALDAGDYDIVHRITPMSPTLPSYVSGRTKQPFVIGPLNGNLDWPEAFRGEQKREREGLRKLRDLYRYLPYARSTFTRAKAVLAAFRHTIADLPPGVLDRTVSFPEIGFDPDLFHDAGRTPPFSGAGPKRFLFAGRLVPYKVPEAAVRAFAGSDALKGHVLDILGDAGLGSVSLPDNRSHP